MKPHGSLPIGKNVALLVRTAGASRDLLMVVIGFLLLTATPDSIQAFDSGRLGTVAWALMLLGGGVVSFFGVVLRKNVLETSGCLMVGMGFLVWGVAALQQPEITRVTVAVALVFFTGTIGQIWRGTVVSTRALEIKGACRGGVAPYEGTDE